MKKTISINLNKQNFQIEEDAYNKLATYLENIKKHCGAGADAAEVMDDIENSLAEKLKLSLNQYKEIITLEDINSLIKVMGTVEDFDREIGGFETKNSDKEEEPEEKIKRKLYRDTDNAVIGGVAAGLGNYFDIDPVLFRIIFCALIFAGGSAFPIYILFWIAMPEAKTAYQKLEMQGRAPTLAAFKNLAKTGKTLQENFKKHWEKNSTTEKIINLPLIIINGIFNAIKKIWSVIWPITRLMIGIFLSVFSFIAISAIGIICLMALLYGDSSYQIYFIPINELSVLVPYKLIIISGFLSLAIPMILNLIAGVSIIRKKNVIGLTLGSIFLGIWMMAGICFCAFGLRYFPEMENRITNNPLTSYTEQTIDIEGIEEINADGDLINIYIKAGSSTPATLEGRKIDLDNIEIKRDGKKLILTKKVSEDKNDICLNCYLQPTSFFVASSTNLNIQVKNGASVFNENTEIENKIDDEEIDDSEI